MSEEAMVMIMINKMDRKREREEEERKLQKPSPGYWTEFCKKEKRKEHIARLEGKLSTEEISKVINGNTSNPVLSQARYEIGEILGRGTWGSVYSAIDKLTGEEVAIKVLDPTETAKKQMIHRNLDYQKAILNESRKLSACSHIVPGIFDTDNNGDVFIIMPKYNQFLSDVLKDEQSKDRRVSYKNGLTQENILNYLKDIATGIFESHYKLKRVHGDIKPDNVAIDSQGGLLLNDLGTSTCSSIGQTISPRDNMGCLYTRAPECFKEDSHPQKESDVYAFGALAYRMFTGEYPKENKDSKINFNKIPRKFRNLVKSSLSESKYGRPSDGKALVEELEKVEENLNTQKVVRKIWRKAAPWVAIASMLGFCTYQASKIEPTKIGAPRVIMAGPVYLSGNTTDSLEFVRENLNLPEQPINNMLGGLDKIVKNYTDNRNTAYLLKTYRQTLDGRGNFTNEIQRNTYMTYTPDYEKQANTQRVGPIEWYIVGKNIEVGINKAKLQDGSVDLEDALTIARIGQDNWDNARKISGSFDFAKYISAKYSDGKPVISDRDQDFIKAWLAYTLE